MRTKRVDPGSGSALMRRSGFFYRRGTSGGRIGSKKGQHAAERHAHTKQTASATPPARITPGAFV